MGIRTASKKLMELLSRWKSNAQFLSEKDYCRQAEKILKGLPLKPILVGIFMTKFGKK